MPRVQPLPREDLAQYAPMFTQLEEFFGYLPNDYLTMARRDGLLEAVAALTEVILFAPGKVPMDLRLLIVYGASRAAGCMYCTAHSAALSERHGLPLEKVVSIHEFATHPDFTPKERAALQVAAHAYTVPNSASEEDFEELRKYFDDEAIVEIVSLISMMGFYTRWNDTLATVLERPPSMFSQENISHMGWKLDKHQ